MQNKYKTRTRQNMQNKRGMVFVWSTWFWFVSVDLGLFFRSPHTGPQLGRHTDLEDCGEASKCAQNEQIFLHRSLYRSLCPCAQVPLRRSSFRPCTQVLLNRSLHRSLCTCPVTQGFVRRSVGTGPLTHVPVHTSLFATSCPQALLCTGL